MAPAVAAIPVPRRADGRVAGCSSRAGDMPALVGGDAAQGLASGRRRVYPAVSGARPRRPGVIAGDVRRQGGVDAKGW